MEKATWFSCNGIPTWLKDDLFICGEQGQCIILEPSTGNKLFEIELGEPLFASPTLCGPNLLLRTREALHCFHLDDTNDSE